MSYLLDTSVLIGWFRGYAAETDFVGVNDQTVMHISTITYGEFYEGVFTKNHREKRVGRTNEILSIVEVIPVDISISRRFAEIRAGLRRDGKIFGDLDILIAATALEHDLLLVTSNIRHFERVSGLGIVTL
jgi:predicted nucleic acid-binding protein